MKSGDIDRVSYSTVAVSAEVKNAMLSVTLEDGRIISIPTYYFDAIESASKKDLAKVEILYGGKCLHWKSLDVDINVPRLLGLSEDDLFLPLADIYF